MANGQNAKSVLNPRRISFYLFAGIIVLAGFLKLGGPLVATLFSYLALRKLYYFKHRGRWFSVVLFLFLLFVAGYWLIYFVHHTVNALPEIAEKAIPSILQWAREYQIEVPFTDYDSLKESTFEVVKNQAHYLGSFAKAARGATTHIVIILAAILVAIDIFLTRRFELNRAAHPIQNNLYSLVCDELAARFGILYRSFATVMGAQVVISAINTVLTGIFVISVGLPYPVVIIGVTFLCGLLPVLGNLISNTVIVGIGFTISPRMAMSALIFLIVIHKLEYFLNSKIIGQRIKNPLWLTLLGLIIGERLMGIPGMVLAPVFLNYIKLEASQVEVESRPPEGTPPQPGPG